MGKGNKRSPPLQSPVLSHLNHHFAQQKAAYTGGPHWHEGEVHTMAMDVCPLCHPAPVPGALPLWQADGHFDFVEFDWRGKEEQAEVAVKVGWLVVFVSDDLLYLFSLQVDVAERLDSHDHSDVHCYQF